MVAAVYPLAFAAQQVAPPGTDVRNVTPGGAVAHDLEMSSERLELLLGAREVIYLRGFQPAVDRALAKRRAPALDVFALPGLDPLPVSTRDRTSLTLDPHLWLDPLRFRVIGEALAERLAAGDEASAAARSAELGARLEALDAEMRTGLADCRSRLLVSGHAAYGYLATRYGLETASASGVDPEAEPRPRDLEALLERAQAGGTTVVFADSDPPTPLVESLARQLGARVIFLDPLETFSAAAAAAGEDYFSVMRKNLAALQEGLGCQPSSS